MNARDHVGQTGVATSQFVFNMAGGTALEDHLTFKQAFQLGGSGSVLGIPVEIRATSGDAEGKWQTAVADFESPFPGTVATLTISADSIMSTSDSSGGGTTFDPLDIANGDTVEVRCVPIGLSLVAARAPRKLSGSVVQPSRYGNALLAIGAGAVAGTQFTPADYGVAIGDGVQVTTLAGYALGYRASAAQPYSAGVGGYLSRSYYPFGLAIGNGDITLHGGGSNPVYCTHMRDGSILQAKTTNATPTLMQVYDPLNYDGDDNDVIAGTDVLSLDSGLTDFEGFLSVVEAATGDMKRWRFKFTMRTTFDYATTELFGTLDKSEVQADAGASSWDFDVIPNTGDANFSFEVTGEAAHELVWMVSFDSKRHETYL